MRPILTLLDGLRQEPEDIDAVLAAFQTAKEVALDEGSRHWAKNLDVIIAEIIDLRNSLAATAAAKTN